jgi:peptide/nickel transport system substrate-binding protein
MRRLLAALLIVGLLLAGLLVVVSRQAGAQTTRKGGWVDSMDWFNQGDPAQALIQLTNGQMQLYMYYLRSVAQIQSATSNPDIGLINVGGSTQPLFVNPVPVNQTTAPGIFNPMSVREVREALNYLIDRAYIAREIFGGTVLPQTTLWYSQTAEYGRDPVFFSGEDQKYAYNFDTARTMIFDALGTVAGVSYENGQWLYNGNPVAVNIVERTEDQRLQIGQYVASQLRLLGFSVNEIPLPGSGAFAIVYNGPPDTGAWQIYTEGWASTALTAWSDSDVDFYLCGGEGSRIWSVAGGPFSADPALADVCHKLLFGEYADLAERQTLIEKAIDGALKQGVRVWTVAGASFPYAKNAVMPFNYDLAGGPWTLFTLRTVKLADHPDGGGNLLVGNRLQFVSDWNPWNGLDWLYDDLIHRAFADFGTWYHPHTGLVIPVRSDFDVETAGPSGTLPIPTDSYTFDNATNTWVAVPSGTEATSKVTFTYSFGTWHDGSDMTMNDVLYAISLAVRRRNGDIDAHDPDSTTSGAKLFVDTLAGVRKVDETHLEIYLNYWHIDPGYIAIVADPFPDTSWDGAELAMQTVLHDHVRISSVTAATEGLIGMDLTKGETIGFMDREISDGNVSATFVPPGFSSGPFAISSAEAGTRWTNLQAFRAAHNHYYQSNGPYVLDVVDTVAAQVHLTNFDDYVFTADHWDSLIVPKVPAVTVGTPTPAQVVPGLAADFTVTATVAGTAYDDVSMTYLVINPATGDVLFEGTPTDSGAGTWLVSLTGDETGQFVPGAYTLQTISVGAEAAIPVFATRSFTVIPALAYFQALLGTQIGSLENEISTLRDDLDTANANLATAQNTVNGLTGLLYASIAIAVVSLVVAALSVMLLLRRARGGPKAEPVEAEEPPKGPEEL